LILRVGVTEDVRRGADKFEADAIAQVSQLGEAVAGDHDSFMRVAVVALVQDLIDAGFGDGSSGPENAPSGRR